MPNTLETSKLTGTGAGSELSLTTTESNGSDDVGIQGGVVTKGIGWVGSLSLVTNNITGPAMMGLPIVFRQAGVVPTVICIFTVFIFKHKSHQ